MQFRKGDRVRVDFVDVDSDMRITGEGIILDVWPDVPGRMYEVIRDADPGRILLLLAESIAPVDECHAKTR